MRKAIATLLLIAAASWSIPTPADVTVLAVRLGAKNVVTLAKFYESVFGLKEIDRVGTPTTEIIMRYGATVAAAKAGSSPEFLLTRRDSEASDPMPHAVFRVSDVAASLAAAKTAGATLKGDVAAVKIGNMPVKVAMLVDPDGNVIELMELPANAEHLQHP